MFFIDILPTFDIQEISSETLSPTFGLITHFIHPKIFHIQALFWQGVGLKTSLVCFEKVAKWFNGASKFTQIISKSVNLAVSIRLFLSQFTPFRIVEYILSD